MTFNLTPEITISTVEELDAALEGMLDVDVAWLDHLRDRSMIFLLDETEDFYSKDQRRDRDGKFATGGSLGKQTYPSIANKVHDPRCNPPPCADESIGKVNLARKTVLHRGIVNELLHDATPPPEVVFLGGGGGSGKRDVLEKIGMESPSSKIDADDIKTKIPEYEALKAKGDKGAAAYVHEESSKLAKDAQSEARARGVGITVDQVGSSVEKVNAQVAAFKAAGYPVKMAYVTVPTSVAVERAEARAAKTGRAVPETALRAAHRDVSRSFPEIAKNKDIDEIVLVDNRGTEPVIIARGGGGKLDILDRNLYNEFLAKGV